MSEPATWSLELPSSEVAPGDDIEAIVSVVLEAGWHINSCQPQVGADVAPTMLAPAAGSPFVLAGPPCESSPELVFDPALGQHTAIHESHARFKLPLRVPPETPLGTHPVAIDVRAQMCSDHSCLPPTTLTLSVPVTISAAPVDPE